MLIIALLVAMMVFTGLHWAAMPPSRVETIDPRTLHIDGRVRREQPRHDASAPDGKVIVRLVAQQYSFEPQCLVVPAGDAGHVPRARAPTSIHGFVVGTTNANVMLIPGFVATFTTTFRRPGEQLMPCHEYCGTGHEAMWARVQVIPADEFRAKAEPRGKAQLCSSLGASSSPISGSRSRPSPLAILLGEWQMYVRSPLHAWINNPEHYYRSVTAHGTVMAYVLPTLVAMGFGYAISELALKRPLVGLRWAWAGFWLVIAGTVMAAPRWRLGRPRCSTRSIRR